MIIDFDYSKVTDGEPAIEPVPVTVTTVNDERVTWSSHVSHLEKGSLSLISELKNGGLEWSYQAYNSDATGTDEFQITLSNGESWNILIDIDTKQYYTFWKNEKGIFELSA